VVSISYLDGAEWSIDNISMLTIPSEVAQGNSCTVHNQYRSLFAGLERSSCRLSASRNCCIEKTSDWKAIRPER